MFTPMTGTCPIRNSVRAASFMARRFAARWCSFTAPLLYGPEIMIHMRHPLVVIPAHAGTQLFEGPRPS